MRKLLGFVTSVLVVAIGLVSLPASANAVAPSDSLSKSVSLTIAHFNGGSPKISTANAKKIKTFVKSHPGYAKASCVGYTMAPTTTVGNQQLALNRAKNVCALADKFSKQLTIGKVTGRKDNKYGSKIRRATLTLWAPIKTFKVTYSNLNANSGSAPVDAKSPYWSGSAVTVLGNLGHLKRTGFDWIGWNTKADLTGVTFSAGGQFKIQADTVLYPEWTLSGTENQLHSVTYNPNGETSGVAPVDPQSPYRQGARVTVLGNTGSLAKTGYTFAGWNTQPNGSGSEFSPGMHFTATVGVVLYAHWVASSVTVNFDYAGGSGPTASESVSVGSSITLPTPYARAGFAFTGWETTSNVLVGQAGDSYSPSVSTTLVARWAAAYTLTYDSNTASGAPERISDSFVLGSSPISLPGVGSMSKVGYGFAGWSLTAGSGGAGGALVANPYTPSGSVTLYAVWVASALTVTFDEQGGSAVSDTTWVSGGSIADPGSPTRDGYTFTGWFAASSGGSALTFPYSPVGSSNITLYAQWSADSHSVTFDTGGGSLISNGSFVSGGTMSNPGTPTKSGYTFGGWSATSGGPAISFPYSPGVLTDVTLYAIWTADSFSVTFDEQGGSGVTDTTWVTGGSIANPGASSRAGYTFLGWFVASSGGSALTFPYSPSGTSSITLYAQWSANSHNVTFDEQGGSSVSDTTWVTGGSIANPGSPTRAGYSFLGWFVANSGGSALTFPYSPAGTVDITLYAHWSAGSNNVTFDEQGGSAVSDTTYATGGTVANPGSPTRAGYTFLGWFAASSGGSALTFPYSPGGSGAITLYAQWSANSHNVTFDEQGGSSVSDTTWVTGGTIASPGSPTKSGFTFDGWFAASSGGSALTFPYSPSGTADITLYAQWTAVPTGSTLSGTFKWANYGITCSTMTGKAQLWSAGHNSATTLAEGSLVTFSQSGSYCQAAWTLTNVPDGNYWVAFEAFHSDSTVFTQQVGFSSTPFPWIHARWETGGASYLREGAVVIDSASATVYPNFNYTNDLGAPNLTATFHPENDDSTYWIPFTYGGPLGWNPSTPTKAGYTFDGWYTAASGGTRITLPYSPPGRVDVDLYAHWTALGPTDISGYFKFSSDTTSCSLYSLTIDLIDNTNNAVVAAVNSQTFVETSDFKCTVTWSIPGAPAGQYSVRAKVAIADSSMYWQVGDPTSVDPNWWALDWIAGVITYSTKDFWAVTGGTLIVNYETNNLPE